MRTGPLRRRRRRCWRETRNFDQTVIIFPWRSQTVVINSIASHCVSFRFICIIMLSNVISWKFISETWLDGIQFTKRKILIHSMALTPKTIRKVFSRPLCESSPPALPVPPLSHQHKTLWFTDMSMKVVMRVCDRKWLHREQRTSSPIVKTVGQNGAVWMDEGDRGKDIEIKCSVLPVNVSHCVWGMMTIALPTMTRAIHSHCRAHTKSNGWMNY